MWDDITKGFDKAKEDRDLAADIIVQLDLLIIQQQKLLQTLKGITTLDKPGYRGYH
jgi:hypothetical protein